MVSNALSGAFSHAEAAQTGHDRTAVGNTETSQRDTNQRPERPCPTASPPLASGPITPRSEKDPHASAPPQALAPQHTPPAPRKAAAGTVLAPLPSYGDCGALTSIGGPPNGPSAPQPAAQANASNNRERSSAGPVQSVYGEVGSGGLLAVWEELGSELTGGFSVDWHGWRRGVSFQEAVRRGDVVVEAPLSECLAARSHEDVGEIWVGF